MKKAWMVYLNGGKNQPRKRQNDLYVKTGLITRLIDSNDHECYELTLEALKKLDDSNPIGSVIYPNYPLTTDR